MTAMPPCSALVRSYAREGYHQLLLRLLLELPAAGRQVRQRHEMEGWGSRSIRTFRLSLVARRAFAPVTN